jgi:hypothetical protein
VNRPGKRVWCPSKVKVRESGWKKGWGRKEGQTTEANKPRSLLLGTSPGSISRLFRIFAQHTRRYISPVENVAMAFALGFDSSSLRRSKCPHRHPHRHSPETFAATHSVLHPSYSIIQPSFKLSLHPSLFHPTTTTLFRVLVCSCTNDTNPTDLCGTITKSK